MYDAVMLTVPLTRALLWVPLTSGLTRFTLGPFPLVGTSRYPSRYVKAQGLTPVPRSLERVRVAHADGIARKGCTDDQATESVIPLPPGLLSAGSQPLSHLTPAATGPFFS
jgi:hypothetical protein